MTYAILLVVAGLIALAIAPPLLARIPLTADVAERLRATATTAAASTVTAVQQLPSLAQRLIDTVPANPIRAAADGAMLPLVVFTLVLALAIARLAPPVRETVVGFFSGVSDAMLVVVGWVLAAAPVGVFALALSVAARTGIQAAGRAAVLHRGAVGHAAAGHADAVRAGAAVRSRAAAHVRRRRASRAGGRDELAIVARGAARDAAGDARPPGLPPVATSFALPLAVSVLRMNVPPRWVISAVFLGQLYGVEVGFPTLVWVLITAVLISFSVPGIPSASLFMMAPVLVSFGLPAEGVGLLIAVDTIPDMFNTLANVTGHMSSTTVIAR